MARRSPVRKGQPAVIGPAEFRPAGLPHCYNRPIRSGKTVSDMRQKTLIGLLFMTLPGLVLAQTVETQCTYNDMVRRVVIMSEPLATVSVSDFFKRFVTPERR